MGVLLNDKVQVTIVGRCYSQRIMFTMMYECTQAAPAGQSLNLSMQKLRTALQAGGVNDIMTPYVNCLSTDYLSLKIRTQVIAPTRSVYYEEESNRPGLFGPGTVANDAAALTLRTEIPGRRYLATKHIGPAPDDASVQGVLTAAYKDALNDLGSALKQSFQIPVDLTSYRPVVFHKDLLTSTPITGHIIGEQSRTQRRRTVGLGE